MDARALPGPLHVTLRVARTLALLVWGAMAAVYAWRNPGWAVAAVALAASSVALLPGTVSRVAALLVAGPLVELVLLAHASVLVWTDGSRKASRIYVCVGTVAVCNFSAFVLSLGALRHATQLAHVRWNHWRGNAPIAAPPWASSEDDGDESPRFLCRLTPEEAGDEDEDGLLVVNEAFELVETFSDLARIPQVLLTSHPQDDIRYVPSLRDPLVWSRDPVCGGLFSYSFPGSYLVLMRALRKGAPLSSLMTPALRPLWCRLRASMRRARIVHTPAEWQADVRLGRARLEEARASFARDGYCSVRDLFAANPLTWDALQRYYRRLWKFQVKTQTYARVDELYCVRWREPFAIHLTHQLTAAMATIVGCSLVPQRPVTLWYPPDSIIAAHFDDAIFTFSLSILVDATGPHARDMALWLLPHHSRALIERNPGVVGQGLAFAGTTTPHFRERLPSDTFCISVSMAWDAQRAEY